MERGQPRSQTAARVELDILVSAYLGIGVLTYGGLQTDFRFCVFQGVSRVTDSNGIRRLLRKRFRTNGGERIAGSGFDFSASRVFPGALSGLGFDVNWDTAIKKASLP